MLLLDEHSNDAHGLYILSSVAGMMQYLSGRSHSTKTFSVSKVPHHKSPCKFALYEIKCYPRHKGDTGLILKRAGCWTWFILFPIILSLLQGF